MKATGELDVILKDAPAMGATDDNGAATDAADVVPSTITDAANNGLVQHKDTPIVDAQIRSDQEGTIDAHQLFDEKPTQLGQRCMATSMAQISSPVTNNFISDNGNTRSANDVTRSDTTTSADVNVDVTDPDVLDKTGAMNINDKLLD